MYTKLHCSYTGFNREKTEFKIKSLKYQEQKIFEI